MAKKPAGAPRPGTQVFYATNRADLSDGFDMNVAVGKESRLTLGSVEVEALGKPELTEADRLLAAPPAKTGADDFADPDGGPCAMVLDAWLASAAKPDALALLFIHGFSNSFDSAVQRAAQLADFYAAEGLRLVPLAFSWPSDGKMIAHGNFGNPIAGALKQYRLDQQDAAAAGPALARLLAEIRRARARQKPAAAKATRLALLAHSMGNHALANGLLALKGGLMTAQMRGLFNEAFLASADVSSAAFAPGMSLRLIADLAARVTVGISFDSTLSLVSEIANNETRLGHSGPHDLAALPASIEVVDYFVGLDPATAARLVQQTGVTSFDTEQHQWYRNDFKARADIAAFLAGMNPPRRRKLPPAQQTIAKRTRQFELS
ncbi:MAG TPA: alpha/beta hydrolase [Falsiroseomonas sp.]|jgi:esterase/lipase superfamily enzyme|nr:alpha/beta hydrolase [Falsiroseomonas sp.]